MTNLLGDTLGRTLKTTQAACVQAKENLWEANGIDTDDKKAGYKMAETKTAFINGSQVITYRLYKLVDTRVVTVSTEVVSKIEKEKK